MTPRAINRSKVVRTIIELARVVYDVVAEGIETCEQYRLLREMAYRHGQWAAPIRPPHAPPPVTSVEAPRPDTPRPPIRLYLAITVDH